MPVSIAEDDYSYDDESGLMWVVCSQPMTADLTSAAAVQSTDKKVVTADGPKELHPNMLQEKLGLSVARPKGRPPYLIITYTWFSWITI
jgi:hypothetical protein